MKKTIFLLLTMLFSMGAMAQDDVVFEFSDGISNTQLKKKMEQNVTRLLNAINRAEAAESPVNYQGIDIDEMASESINMLWKNVRFHTADDDIVEHCLQLKNGRGAVTGYQVRNIAMEMVPVNDSYEDDTYQEVCIDFDRQGRIADFNIAMDIHQYMQILKEGKDLEDEYQRKVIVGFCEQFKTAYMHKDIRFMENIFSDDALIITGKVITRKQAEVGLVTDVVLNPQTKSEYLQRLRDIFAKNKRIKVDFTDYKVSRHGAKPNYYGVSLVQDWSTDSYSDTGYVFLVWDFSDKDSPKIQVRVWQPKETPSDQVVDFSNSALKLRSKPNK